MESVVRRLVMKNSELNRKNAGATGIAYKACVWILSIMLVVTGMAPSFAANDADVKAGRGKVQTDVSNAFSSFYKNTKSSSKTSKKNFDKASLKDKATESIKNEARNAKTPNEAKGKEDKYGKHNKIKNKRGQTFELNSSDNVYAEFDGNETLTVSAKNPLGDMNIEGNKWWGMIKKLGGDGFDGWKNTRVKNIIFNAKGISLPKKSMNFFREIKGVINGCENLNTSNVTYMSNMFYGASSANPDVSKWDTSNVILMGSMFNSASSANPDVSKWNTSNVTYMSNMFYGASSANPNVSKWNTSKVENMWSMFYRATSANPDVSKWNTSGVIDMSDMFYGASSANPDISNWDVSNVKNMKGMLQQSAVKALNLSSWKLNQDLLNDNDKMQDVFKGCINVEYLKTPAGLRTSIDGVNAGFKIVRLKKDSAASIEQENYNLNDKYEINKDGDSGAIYHIYNKNKYAGVTFDKNNGDTESWINHEIVEKGEEFSEGGGIVPAENPTYEGYEFLGWAKNNSATVSDFDEHTVILQDMKVYSMWGKSKVNITFDKTEGEGNMPAVEVVKGSKYKLPESTFTAPAGKEFDKWSVKIGSAPAEGKQPGDKITASDDVTVKAVWKDKNLVPPLPGKVRVTLDGNGGVLAGGAFATIDVDEGSTLKEQLESAVANKIFTKDAYKLIGFSRSKFATTADYNLDAPVYSDMTLYAVYKEAPAVTNVTIKYTEVGMDEDEVIENVPTGKPIGDKLDGHERVLAGHRFLGYSKEKNAVKPDFFKKSVVTNGLVLYPVYKETGNVDKAKVAFNLNDGTDANLKTQLVTRYESLGAKMPNDKYEREDYLFTGWAKSKAAKYPDFFRGTKVKGDMTVYAVWKSLYNEKLGQAVLKVAAKAKGYELTIESPKANLHTGFEIFRSEKKDFKPNKDNKIATVDRNTLKYLDEKTDKDKAYYYAVRAIDVDGSYNGTKVTFIGKLSDKVLAAPPLPKDKGVTATVTGKGTVDLEFNKTIAAVKYKVTVTAPYDKKFKEQVKEIEASKLVAAGGNKVKANITGLAMGKFLAFKLEALEADNTKLVEYSNSFAFMLGAVDKLSTKVNNKKRVLNVQFKAMKGVSGYEAKIVINGKVKTIKLKKGKKKLKGFMTGSIKLPKKKGNYTFTIRAFKKIGKLKYYGQTITKTVK